MTRSENRIGEARGDDYHEIICHTARFGRWPAVSMQRTRAH